MATRVDVIVGQRIRRRRRLLGMTQQHLGLACGVSFQRIHKYESALARISVATLWKVAGALEVNIDYFFTAMDEALMTDRQGRVAVRAAAVGRNGRLAA